MDGIEKLKMRPYQEELFKTVQPNIESPDKGQYVILKNRQNGTTTLIGSILLINAAYRKGFVANTLADTQERASAVFQNIVKFAWDRIPDPLKPSIDRNNVQQLDFGGIGSKYIISATKSEPVDLIHISEGPYFIHEERITEALQMVRPTGTVIMESTAYGVGNLFEQTFTKAWAAKQKGLQHHWTPIFHPWYIDPTNISIGTHIDNTAFIEELTARYNLTLAQQYFYDQKYTDLGDEVFQFYPSEPMEAFLQSGRPVFNQKRLADLKAQHEREPIYHENGFAFYEELDPDVFYGIGVDTAEGLEHGDNSVIIGTNAKTGKEAFKLQGKYAVHELANKMGWICERTKHVLVIERNNHGHAVIAESRHNEAINFYRTEDIDKVTEKTNWTIGWNTNEKSKAHIIAQLRKGLDEGYIIPQDAETYLELTFYVHGDRGKMNAQKGKHDDSVIALALSNIACEQDMVELSYSASDYGL